MRHSTTVSIGPCNCFLRKHLNSAQNYFLAQLKVVAVTSILMKLLPQPERIMCDEEELYSGDEEDFYDKITESFPDMNDEENEFSLPQPTPEMLDEPLHVVVDPVSYHLP